VMPMLLTEKRSTGLRGGNVGIRHRTMPQCTRLGIKQRPFSRAQQGQGWGCAGPFARIGACNTRKYPPPPKTPHQAQRWFRLHIRRGFGLGAPPTRADEGKPVLEFAPGHRQGHL
jgi:hypothetical protein